MSINIKKSQLTNDKYLLIKYVKIEYPVNFLEQLAF